MATSSRPVEDVTRSLGESLLPLGFEVYPLKVGWYNAVLSEAFHLPYPEDTLAVVVLSAPGMFEKAFLPFLKAHSGGGLHDYIDQCTAHCISSAVTSCFSGRPVDISYDYEMHPNRKPKFLAQTATHVAGAAYYYQQSDVPDPPWGNKKMFGVCIHPRLGGWFAVRALLVFKDVRVGEEELCQQAAPLDCVRSREERIELLERFNLRWQDGTYRDIIQAEESYSQQQREYFTTAPGERVALLKRWGYLSGSTTETETETESQPDTRHGCELSHG
ncbi:cyanocobalamin reductase / alkylcobalamin dealkylase [Engraulis encrasicolus]|uniref:cyanocobalamin reductase / alkylcobalamin dealkylase n=1 Tax=Engraulis encrasicolus TaxID=184585 RepID=UPI002FD6578E